MLATLGHNKPPGPIDFAREALAELNAYLKENPVVQTHEDAKGAAAWVERTRKTLQVMEAARVEQVAPLNTELKAINELYRKVREPLERVFAELKRRYNAWDAEETRKREAAAAQKRAEAEAAKAAAEQAAQAADNAIACADVGECTDAGQAIADADSAIKAAGKAERAAQVAERETTVRVRSIMGGKALSASAKTKLSVANLKDAHTLLDVLGLTPDIEATLCTAARKYERANEEWPKGLTVTIERGV